MSYLNDSTRDRRVDHQLRKAVGNIQHRFLDRIAERMETCLSLRELSEELIIEAISLSNARYGCLLQIDDKGLLTLDACAHIDTNGASVFQQDELLDVQPDQIVQDVIDELKPIFSNHPSISTLPNLPHSHPGVQCYALCPLHEHGTLKALLIVINANPGFDIANVQRLQSMLDAFFRVHSNSVVNRGLKNVINGVGDTNRQLLNLLDASFNSVLSVDDQFIVTAINPACENLFNVDRVNALGISLECFLERDTFKTLQKNATHYSQSPRTNNTSPYNMENVNIFSSDGRKVAVALNVFHSCINQRVSTTLVFDTRDQYKAEQRLIQIAHHDPLTGLPNRTRFLEHLHRTLDERYSHGLISLLFINLDGFKAVNDTMGHDAGDELLQQVAIRLRDSARDGDAVARLGGDEFTLTLHRLEHIADVTKVADTIVNAIKQPFLLHKEEVYVSVSIGIATATGLIADTKSEANRLIKHADIALYRAKLSGRSRYVFFTPELDQARRDRSVLITSLRRAVDHEDFELFYQPQVLIRGNQLLGFEALLRWPQDGGAHISPGAFIDVLEETGLIGELGEWALAQACKQHGKWLENGLIGPATTMSVNVSARQLGTPYFANRVADILQKHSMRPDSLILEITESALVQTIETGIIYDIKALGVQISLDDFGTGYSSLAYLSQLPLDHLKIDRSFIADIERFPHAVTVVKSIIALANTLGIRVIAEGVESASVLPLLASEGCEGYQGFHFSEPLSAAQMAVKLKSLQKVRLSHYAYFIDLENSSEP